MDDRGMSDLNNFLPFFRPTLQSDPVVQMFHGQKPLPHPQAGALNWGLIIH